MKLLTPKDAAALLGLTTSGLIQAARRGEVHELRDSGGRRLFDPAEIARVKAAREKARAGK